MRAIWKDTVIAESDNTIIVEGNHYFPPDSVKKQYLRKSEHHTTCPWKGKADYYDVVVDSDVIKNAAWYYPEPKSAAEKIKNHVAFWHGVEVKE
jgi:uncharacterized protein (DUF427 family)